MNSDHLDDDTLIALALDGSVEPVDGTEHLRGCGSCRSRYDEVRLAIDSVLPAVSSVEPSPGFDDRVLAAMGMSTAGPAAPVTAPTPLPVRGDARRRRWMLPAAAALAVGLALGAGATWIATKDTHQEQTTGVALTTAEGEVVGSVDSAVDNGEQVLVINVDGAPDQARYLCRVHLSDGTSVDIGTWTLPDGTGSWVISQVEPDQVSLLEMVRPDGTTWSSADL